MQERGWDGEARDASPSSESDQPVRRRGSVPPGSAGPQANWAQPGPTGYAPGQAWPPPAAPKKKPKWPLGCLGAVVLLVAIMVGAALAHKDNPSAATGSPSAPAATGVVTASTSPGAQATAQVAVAAPTAAAPVAQTVTYSCTGHAPDGINITYGPEGSSFAASTLPFTQTAALDSTVQYYVTEAQLQGGGSVSCSTVINYTDGSGTSQSVTKNAAASGGYNIASAEVCSDFESGWEGC